MVPLAQPIEPQQTGLWNVLALLPVVYKQGQKTLSYIYIYMLVMVRIGCLYADIMLKSISSLHT